MKKLLVSMFALTAVSTVFAAEAPFTAEILVGQTTQSLKGDGFNTKDADDTSIAIRFGYEFIKSWSAELAYYDYGKVTVSEINEDAEKYDNESTSSTFLLGIKKEFNLNEKLSLNARVGMAFWDFDYKLTFPSDPSFAYNASDKGDDLYYGLGLAYVVKENLLVAVDYSFVSMGTSLKTDESPLKPDNDVKTFSIGIGYQF